MSVEWDSAKALANQRKHDVDFADAVGALEDPFGLWREDTRPYEEERYVALGTDYTGRLIVVAFTFRGEQVRLISARRATPQEQVQYEQRRG